MKYLTPEIAKLSKKKSTKSLAKPGISCGIFQDCMDTDLKYSKKVISISSKKKN